MRLVSGVAQHYAWGDTGAIPELVGAHADGRPWAEWWLGTHHGGPATLDGGELLSSVTGPLPYLVKLLAAAEPLSLQTHPDAATAAAGFAREEAAGIALDDPVRIYRDAAAKPEIICALSPFEALCGFLPAARARRQVDAVDPAIAEALLSGSSVEPFVRRMYTSPDLAGALVERCRHVDTDAARLAISLAERYPDDPSVAVTLVMHHVVLAPGDALYLDAGNLHAYLHGVGVEVMGSSDNVVRGGLTVKHVDVDELLRVLRFEALDDPVVRPVEESSGTWHYPTPGAPFTVRRLEVAVGSASEVTASGHDLLLCTAGDAGVLRRGQCLHLAPGERAHLRGPATVFHITP